MINCFKISVTFLDGRFHGQSGDNQPEWPPSPLRLFQACVAANAHEIAANGDLAENLRWLERQQPPVVNAPESQIGTGYVLSVPNNAMDIPARAWSKGNYFGSGDSNPATHRTMKRIRPVHLLEDGPVEFIWTGFVDDDNERLEVLARAFKRVYALGWGTDLVAVDAQVGKAGDLQTKTNEEWLPDGTEVSNLLRLPIAGTLKALTDRHQTFLNRIKDFTLVPVEPFSSFALSGYRRRGLLTSRPSIVFELRDASGNYYSHPQRKLIHLSGMLRHLVIETLKNSPPPEIEDVEVWLDRYVAGHARDYEGRHKQLSYIPLPSIGHEFADHAIRRVMIVASAGDNQILSHLRVRLAGQVLKPLPNTKISDPPTLESIQSDGVIKQYVGTARTWTSVTPVILPGHDDRKPVKTRRLIEKALDQSGVEQKCDVEWRTFPWLQNSLPAFKYDRSGKQAYYLRPKHLEQKTLIHLKLTFQRTVSGPIAIGAGRHCGFGLMTPIGPKE